MTLRITGIVVRVVAGAVVGSAIIAAIILGRPTQGAEVSRLVHVQSAFGVERVVVPVGSVGEVVVSEPVVEVGNEEARGGTWRHVEEGWSPKERQRYSDIAIQRWRKKCDLAIDLFVTSPRAERYH